MKILGMKTFILFVCLCLFCGAFCLELSDHVFLRKKLELKHQSHLQFLLQEVIDKMLLLILYDLPLFFLEPNLYNLDL